MSPEGLATTSQDPLWRREPELGGCGLGEATAYCWPPSAPLVCDPPWSLQARQLERACPGNVFATEGEWSSLRRDTSRLRTRSPMGRLIATTGQQACAPERTCKYARRGPELSPTYLTRL